MKVIKDFEKILCKKHHGTWCADRIDFLDSIFVNKEGTFG